MNTTRSLLDPARSALTLLAALCALSAFSQSAVAQETADGALPILTASDTEALKKKDGQKVTVIGKCDRTGKSRGGTNFVNFEGAEFTLVTFKSDLGPFTDGEPADLYEGKFLSVTGVIGIYKDAPQIKLTDPAQVKMSDEAFELPKKEEMKPASASGDQDEAGADGKAKSDAKPTAEDDGEKTEDGKPKPPVDPRKYFNKPTTPK